MAQDPIQLDAIQIEASSGDTLTISRSTDGDLEFVDAKVTDGIGLARLAGVTANATVLVVGDNAQYSTIQDAVDAVSATSSATNPHTILVTSGTYSENITIDKDGISVVGIGRPVVSAAAGDTFTIQAGVSTTPKTLDLVDLRVQSSEDSSSCVRVIGGAGSTIGEDRIRIQNCELQASGVGSRPLRASTVGNIVAVGGDWNPVATTLIEIDQCASVLLKGIQRLSDIQIAYTTASAVSDIAATSHRIEECGEVGDVLINLTGGNSVVIAGCPNVGDVTIGGDRSARVIGCMIGDLTLNNTVTAVSVGSSHGDLAGDGTLSESGSTGEIAFAASAAETVTFAVSQPDNQYFVCTECSMNAAPAIGAKTSEGFTITFDGVQTGTVGWSVVRSTL